MVMQLLASARNMVVLRRLSAAVCKRSWPHQSNFIQLQQQQQQTASPVRVLPALKFLSTSAATSEHQPQQQQQQQQQANNISVPEPDWVRAAIQKMILEQQQSANGSSSSGGSGERDTPGKRDLDKSLQFLQVRYIYMYRRTTVIFVRHAFAC